MNSALKKLASQTAIYGLSSILGRFLNYLLVPLHTAKFSPEQYGIITELYAYVAFLVILLTYGMETAYFRFSTKNAENPKVFSTTLWSLLGSTAIFWIVALSFHQGIADWLKYPRHAEYVVWFAFIVGLDAITSIPLARMRQENKAFSFAAVNLGNIAINIGLNLFFLAYCKPIYDAGETNFWVEHFYSPNIGVGYVFIANLIASIFKFAFITPYLRHLKNGLSISLYRPMLKYGLPLLLAGLAGIVNETLDRILLKRLLFEKLGAVATMEQIGIYGAVYKISILITLFIQAYRYAAEPFFFNQEKQHTSKQTYATVMNYFVAALSLVFLGIMFYLDLIKYFIQSPLYYEGLKVVPILLLANICLGIYFNLSIWYKLSEQTKYGAYLAFVGAGITIVGNFILIPTMGYEGSAWATLICYASMVVLSYLWGQKHYPIQYDVLKVIGFMTLALFLWLGIEFIADLLSLWQLWVARHLAIAAFIVVVVLALNPKKVLQKG